MSDTATDLDVVYRLARGAPAWRLKLAKVMITSADRADFYAQIANFIDTPMRLTVALAAYHDIAVDRDPQTNKARKPNDAMGYCVADILYRVSQRGEKLSKAVAAWFPNSEAMAFATMLDAGLSGESLRMLSRTTVKLDMAMRRARRNAWPLVFLLLSCYGIVWVLAVWLFPELLGNDPSIRLTGQALLLKNVCDFMADFGVPLLLAVIAAGSGVVWSFANLAGPLRWALDRWPGYRLYAEWTGCMFLKTLGPLLKTRKLPECLDVMRATASPYLAELIGSVQKFQHLHIGAALAATRRDWPSRRLIKNMRGLQNAANPSEAINEIADTQIDRIILNMETMVETVSFITVLLVSFFTVWFVFATQDVANALNTSVR